MVPVVKLVNDRAGKPEPGAVEPSIFSGAGATKLLLAPAPGLVMGNFKKKLGFEGDSKKKLEWIKTEAGVE